MENGEYIVRLRTLPVGLEDIGLLSYLVDEWRYYNSE
jgi:hypothetical protein